MIELVSCARIRIGNDTENANATAIAIAVALVCSVYGRKKCIEKKISP